MASFKTILDNLDRAWTKLISNSAPFPKNSYYPTGLDSKNPVPAQSTLQRRN